MSEESTQMTGGRQSAAKRARRRIHSRWSTTQKLTLTSVAISALSFFFAVGALLYTVRKEREMKMLDMLSHFQQRYDLVVYDVKSKVQAGNARALEAYYYRFWDLQFEQYQDWKAGFITPEIFTSWMDFRNREWQQNEEVGGMKYQQGWEESRKYLGDEKFSQFMKEVFKGNRAAYANGP